MHRFPDWPAVRAAAIVCCLLAAVAAARMPAPQASGTWLGQDGHDLIGTSPQAVPNGVQDAHIRVDGLPAGQAIVFVDIQGQGGGEWQYGGAGRHWAVAVVQQRDAGVADLYFEPGGPETRRPFAVTIRLADGREVQVTVAGGRWDPARRMPQAALQVRWVGQDGADYTGPGPAVGPDGFQDVHLVLSRLFPSAQVRSVAVTARPASHGAAVEWEYGLNPRGVNNAELIRRPDDPSRADLYFSPTSDLAGRTLAVSLVYDQSGTDSATLPAGPCDPALPTQHPALPRIVPLRIGAHWRGQDARGDASIALSELPAGRTVVGAALSDPSVGYWTYGTLHAPADLPLAWRPVPGGAVISFTPIRPEESTMVLRLAFADGTLAWHRFAGWGCNPEACAPALPPGAATAHPGDDLHDLVGRCGTIRLARGEYRLDRPLALTRPVTITGEPGATLLFAQPAQAPPWSEAIRVGSGRTTLEGFAVRFAAPVRWSPDAPFGPAVIGAADRPAGPRDDPRAGIVLRRLDLESPPVPAGSPLAEAPRLVRMTTAACGSIEGCDLKGGSTEVRNGPWRILDNEYLGCMPGTFCYDAFAGHYTHDVTIAHNRVHPVAPCGETWRFLVLTQQGIGDTVLDNRVEGVGMRDDDTISNPNAPEIILTEAYRLHFEGWPSAVSEDRHIFQVPLLQGPPARTGDVVSVLGGPDAGRWVRIAQALSPTTYLLEMPLPPGRYPISVSTGFVGETFQGNTVDCRGSTRCADLVLVGNHFGTRVLRNRFTGGGEPMRITAAPTELPVLWGWSHAPFLEGEIARNTFEDCARPGTISVEHSRYIKTTRGRTYMGLRLVDNTFTWTSAFAARLPARELVRPRTLTAANIGDPGSLDPAELDLAEKGNAVYPPAGWRASARVRAAVVNGRTVREAALQWAPPRRRR